MKILVRVGEYTAAAPLVHRVTFHTEHEGHLVDAKQSATVPMRRIRLRCRNHCCHANQDTITQLLLGRLYRCEEASEWRFNVFIVMEHEETGGVAPVDEAAFRAVWADRGWTKVTKASKKTRDALIQERAQAVADGEAEAFKEAEAAHIKELRKVKADAKARSAKQAKDGKK